MANMKLSSLLNAHIGVNEWRLNIKHLESAFEHAYSYLVKNGAHPFILNQMIVIDIEIQRLKYLPITSSHSYVR